MTKQANKFDAFLDITKVHEDEGNWIIEGFATTADLDVDDGYITEEALKGARNDLLKYSTLLYNHDRNAELGKVLETKYIPEERALWIKALISKTAPDVWQKIKEGVLNKFSINGRALDWEEVLIKGMGKIVTFIKSLSLFEASLVTVPADASSRTLAWYVERSIKNRNFKEDNSMSKKKELSRETKDVGRDKERVEALVTSIEEALTSEDQEVHAQTFRSVLDFLQNLLKTQYSGTNESERGASGDLKALISDAIGEKFSEITSQISAIAESVKAIVEADAEDKKAREAQIEADLKAKEEAEEEEAKKEEIEKSAKEEDNGKANEELTVLRKNVDDLTNLVKDNFPIRRAPGAEDHKEDERPAKEEKEKDVTKTEEFKSIEDPRDRLRALLGSVGSEE